MVETHTKGLFEEHVERFNAGVRDGDWSAMLEQLTESAEMKFRGIPVGPYAGKDAIAAAYRERPPDDELRVLESRERDGRIEARYAWQAEPEVAVGELLLTPEGGRIARLVVTFERGVEWS